MANFEKILAVIIFIIVLAASGCCGTTNTPAATATPAGSPVPKGDRMLGIAAMPASDNDYARAFTLARGAGLDTADVSLKWDEVEPSAGQYKDPGDALASANGFYPAQGIPVTVVLAGIDTNNDRRPSDLKGKALDDPEVIDRYEKAADYVFSKLPNVKVIGFSAGNEVDAYLGNDDARWQQYKNFYEKVARHVKAVKPGVDVGVKATIGGANYNSVSRVKDLNAASDVIMVTYYPLEGDFSVKDPSVVQHDFDTICAAYPGKKVEFIECGYPSGTADNSSEEKQAEFVRQVFRAWDRHSDQVRIVSFFWLHDVSPSLVEGWLDYYGLHDAKFAAYLGTIGLRTYDGKDKLAWTALKEEAKARGW